MKTLLITGSKGPYIGDTAGMDVWVVGYWSIKKGWHPEMDRFYFMDDLELFDDGFVPMVNALGCEVVANRAYPEIAACRAFDLERAKALSGGRGYFTSSVAYMLADAIAEGYGRVMLHRFNENLTDGDYFHQKACLDFWCGIAIGRGIEVVTGERSHLCRDYPWSAGMYGYDRDTEGERMAKRIIRSALCDIDRRMADEDTMTLFWPEEKRLALIGER